MQYSLRKIAMEKIVIGVCTAKRPRMLLACLQSLARNTAPAATSVEIVVIDNEAEPNNRKTVTEFSCRSPFAVHYVHEARRGIPQARNAALAKALELSADWLAFIDDDETAQSDWLTALHTAAKSYQADAVAGPVVWDYPEKMPFWGIKKDPPFTAIREAQIIGMMPTYNLLTSMRLFRPSPNGMGLRFDEALAFSGGEDTWLANQAAALGARMIWTTKAIVFGTVCTSRLSYTHNLRWSYHRGLLHVMSNPAKPKVVSGALLGAAKGGVWLAVLPALALLSKSAFKRKGLAAGSYLAYAAGVLAGRAGIRSKYYRKIEGY